LAFIITVVIFHVLNRITKIKYFDDTHVDAVDVYWGHNTVDELIMSHARDLTITAILLGILFYLVGWF
jgi:hypothetical protein